ncbi:MAG: GTPase HflX [Candidatus Eutrophobiaceae bacterium]
MALQIMRVLGDCEDADEFLGLVGAAGMHCLDSRKFHCRRINPHTFIGSGKVAEIGELAKQSGADLIVVNQALEASQERNLERQWQLPVLDRIALILDIFAQRARTHEGKLQVELAQLEHLSTRLVRGWTHLERQKGGIGLRGPGETQLETDRRLIGKRMKMLKRRLQKVSQQRHLGQCLRRKRGVSTVLLAGYTNAGKSTLFNCLSGSRSPVADQLFSTLDPSSRSLRLPSGRRAVLIDTVGFISDLPHELIAAFEATLEQLREAVLLLHVVDAGDIEHRAWRIAEVERVIDKIGAGEVPQLQVWNKMDLLPGFSDRQGDWYNGTARVPVSAHMGVGMDRLLAAIDDSLDRIEGSETCRLWLALPPGAGALRAQLHELGVVQGEEGGCMEVSANRRVLERVCSDHSFNLDDLLGSSLEHSSLHPCP